MTLRVERPKNLTENARDHLRKAIIEGRLAFGEPLSELSVSRVPRALSNCHGLGLSPAARP
jgi:DNA-binding GntR family transcriptional regulator